jgi:hypothetical protein
MNEAQRLKSIPRVGVVSARLGIRLTQIVAGRLNQQSENDSKRAGNTGRASWVVLRVNAFNDHRLYFERVGEEALHELGHLRKQGEFLRGHFIRRA